MWYVATLGALRNSQQATVASTMTDKAGKALASLNQYLKLTEKNSPASSKKIGVALFVAAMGWGWGSLVQNPPTNAADMCVLLSAALMPVVMHYDAKGEEQPLSQKDKIIKNTAFAGHVLADSAMIILGGLSSNPIAPTLTDKMGDLWVAGITGRIVELLLPAPEKVRLFGVFAKVTSNVLAVAAMQNVMHTLSPALMGVYAVVYGAHYGEILLKAVKNSL
jgi:hypothetical protein